MPESELEGASRVRVLLTDVSFPDEKLTSCMKTSSVSVMVMPSFSQITVGAEVALTIQCREITDIASTVLLNWVSGNSVKTSSASASKDNYN